MPGRRASSKTPNRNELRLKDLMEREVSPSRLMNVKVPAATLDGIDALAKATGASKTDVVIALLNEGLVRAREEHPDRFPKS